MLFIKSCKASCLYIQDPGHFLENIDHISIPHISIPRYLLGGGGVVGPRSKCFSCIWYIIIWNKWSYPYWIRLVAFSTYLADGWGATHQALDISKNVKKKPNPIIANTVRFFYFKHDVYLLINRHNSYSLNFYP